VGEGIEGLVHISEMAAHHVEAPDQVVTAGEELWVKIIELDTAVVASVCRSSRPPRVARSSEEYREAFGSHAYDNEGNYIGTLEFGEFTPETRRSRVGGVRHRSSSEPAGSLELFPTPDVPVTDDASAPERNGRAGRCERVTA